MASAWQDMTDALDGLIENAQAVHDYLQTRHPEEGGHLVYTPLEPLIEARDKSIDLIRKTQEALKSAGQAPAGWQDAINEKVVRFQQLDGLNQAKFGELADFYKGKLRAAKQSRDTVSAYKQQYQTAIDMSVGGLLNKVQ
ncbi:MAG: hypothetical protein HDQ87_02575 [Clostridia bacterium]|nr:hypothetical protein [Clostridia bacterium]